MCVQTSGFANISSQIIFSPLYRDPQLQVGEKLNYITCRVRHILTKGWHSVKDGGPPQPQHKVNVFSDMEDEYYFICICQSYKQLTIKEVHT